jgi:hypothetical protein
MGITNEAVLPDPVGAMPRISFPFIIAGIAFFCTGYTDEKFWADIAFKSSGDISKIEKGIYEKLMRVKDNEDNNAHEFFQKGGYQNHIQRPFA